MHGNRNFIVTTHLITIYYFRNFNPICSRNSSGTGEKKLTFNLGVKAYVLCKANLLMELYLSAKVKIICTGTFLNNCLDMI